ncbi:MAG: aminopeptidase N [Pseudomonadota bacterium]|nr:aminopeptidase N [Pseudomonadota bacterium]
MTDSRAVNSAPSITRLVDYEAFPFSIDSVDLSFELDPTCTRVTQSSIVRRIVSGQHALELNGKNLNRISIKIDGAEIETNRLVEIDETLLIRQVPDEFHLEIETEINPEANTALEGLYLSKGMFCTQCEAEGFRRITYYPDRPDVMSIFKTRIISDASQSVLLSNGNPVSDRLLPDGRREVVWHDPFPKPCYLFALVGGDLAVKHDEFVTMSGRCIDLRIYVEPKDLDRVDYALASLKRAMAWDETVYGREYDLDIFMIVAVSHFNMGAMENKGLNIFNSSCVLANADAATDQAFQRIEAIVAHEYFHNWSGNRVTCRDWFQLSLKEGFTVFRDSEFSADTNSRAVKRIQDVNYLRSAQFTEDSGPTAHPVQPSEYQEISNFYTLTIYEKGAEVVRMIHTLLGPELFRKGSDLYFHRHDGQAVTINEFVDAMAEVSGRDFSQFMRWYRQPGTPRVRVDIEHNPDTETLRIQLAQRSPVIANKDSHKPYAIPVRYQVIDQQTGEVLVPDTLVELTEEIASITCAEVSARPVVSILRGLSAPVKLEMDRQTSDLVALARFDDDGVNRWDAIQELYMHAIQVFLETPEASLDQSLQQLICDLIQDPSTISDPACLSEMLTLPQDNILWDALQPADPQKILEARKRLRQRIALAGSSMWRTLFEAMRVDGPYQPSAEAIGHRSLAITALGYMARVEPIDNLVLDIEANASNLTERYAAYRIARSDASEFVSQELSQRFIDRAEADEVLDLWLSTEAVNENTATIDRIQELTSHARFAWTNPNRVRSVLGAFANRNVKAFHTPDGYRLLADSVLKLDGMNPQIASRLVMPLCQWGRFGSTFQEQMKAELRRMVAEDLSKDLFEIVSKSVD